MKERLIAQAQELTEKNPLVYIMRHSIRDEIVDHRRPFDAMLTDEGREFARFFGTLLPVSRRVVFFSSPVERCRETAELIAAGFKSVGGEVGFVRPDPVLVELFGESPEAVLEAVQLLETSIFFNRWVKEGEEQELKLKNATMKPFLQARCELKEAVFALALPDCLNIFLTHDYHINILRGDWQVMRELSYQWPHLLGGEILERGE